VARTEKLERLLKLTAVLLNSTAPLTAQQLRSHVEGYPEADASFNRAFERDKDDLRALGIPLKTLPVPFRDPPVDGYDIAAEDYYLPDPELTPDELAALRLAALTIRFDGASEASALWKLGGLGEFGDAVERQDPLASLPTNPALIPLFGAIVDRRRVSFVYNDLERAVSPWKLDYARGRWYLIGYDHGRDAERNFRLDRMTGEISLVGEPGTAELGPTGQRERTLRAWEIGDEDPIVAQLWVSDERAPITQRMLGASALSATTGDDGTLFEVAVSNRDAFRFFVLGLGDQAELVGPSDLRQDIVAWLETLASGV
jgi:proteasome accessory factor B